MQLLYLSNNSLQLNKHYLSTIDAHFNHQLLSSQRHASQFFSIFWSSTTEYIIYNQKSINQIKGYLKYWNTINVSRWYSTHRCIKVSFDLIQAHPQDSEMNRNASWSLFVLNSPLWICFSEILNVCIYNYYRSLLSLLIDASRHILRLFQRLLPISRMSPRSNFVIDDVLLGLSCDLTSSSFYSVIFVYLVDYFRLSCRLFSSILPIIFA